MGSHPRGLGALPALPVPDGFFGTGAVPDGFLEAVLALAALLLAADFDGFGFPPAGSVPFPLDLGLFPPSFGAGQPGRSAGVVALGGVGLPEALVAFAAPVDALPSETEAFVALAEAFVTLAEALVALALGLIVEAFVMLALLEADEPEVALKYVRPTAIL